MSKTHHLDVGDQIQAKFVTTEVNRATDPVDCEVDVEIARLLPKQFAISGQSEANWLVRRVLQARQYAETVKAWASQEQRRAEREEATLMFLFGRQIETWVRDELKKSNGRRKSLCLPAGKVGFRNEKARLVIDDEASVLVWAKDHIPEAVEIVEKLSKSIVKGHFDETGEVPDGGVHIQPERERFYVG